MPRQAKTATTPVSEKSTKSEILDAYNALLASITGFDDTNEETVEEQKLVDKAASETVEKIQHEARIQQTMAGQTADAKLKLAEQKIASLEATLASLLSENKDLKQQLDKATTHIKDIAVSVVEGTRKENNNQTRAAGDAAK